MFVRNLSGTVRPTLCCCVEWSSLKLMKFWYTILIALFGVASPLSLWAEVVFPCAQRDQLLSWDSVIDLLAHTDVAAHKDRDSTHGKSMHHGGGKNSDSTVIDCECCVSCISICASSAGTHGAIGSESLDPRLANQNQFTPAAKTIHCNPDPISLFRPPKPNA